jgi:hypothetical protein
MRRSYTAVVERGRPLQDDFVTEPYEAGWASEALFFVRLLDDPDQGPDAQADVRVNARVQLSPDGMYWVDEGSALPELVQGSAFVRVREFGNWLRLAGTVAPPGRPVQAIVYLALKE